MKIIIEPLTLEKAQERGANEDEIITTIEQGEREVAKQGRISSSKVFEFNKLRNGKFYEHKKIEVIFVEENNQINTVTVYVYYGIWK